MTGKLTGRTFAFTGTLTRWGNFHKASFRRADLRGADLTGANLCGADLSTANLTGANLKQIKYDRNTRLPKGFKVDGLDAQ